MQASPKFTGMHGYTILEIAHKELMQAGQYTIDCWHKPFYSLTTAIPSTTGLANVFKRAIPANKVIHLFKVVTEPRNNGQRDAISYLKIHLRGLVDEKLRMF